MRHPSFGIDKMIQDAQKEGKFDDLSCKGQPLDVAFGDLASVANDVMRDNGIVPEWIELARGIEALQARQSALMAGLEARRREDRAELERALLASCPAAAKTERGWRRRLVGWWYGERRVGDPVQSRPPAIVERMEKDRQRTLIQVAELVRAERRKVDRYNLVESVGGRQMRRVRVEDRLRVFQEQFPHVALDVGEGEWRLRERVESIDPRLLTDAEESTLPTNRRGPEQAEALQALRASRRKSMPM
jgi:hypothetical protein